MKTITKTFYIDQVFFLMLLSSHKNKCEFQKDLAQFFTKNHNGKMREIQISWQEPEKKIEITESQLNDLFIRAHNKVNQSKGLLTLKPYAEDLMDEIKKLFGASDE